MSDLSLSANSAAPTAYKMHTLENGSLAPLFTTTDLNGQTLSLNDALTAGPVILVFGHPQINASRLVVGYLRRLAEIAPAVPVWVMLECSEGDARKYVGSGDQHYLEMPVVVDDCRVASLYSAKYLPTTYFIGQEGKIIRAYTGFNRDFMNMIANEAATMTANGAEVKAKELITDSDNKGSLELAERGPCL
jgi:AhpC/TSA family